MKDPDRLSDGADGLEASLLRTAKKYRVSDEARRRAYAAVGLGAPPAAPGGGVARAAASGSKLKALTLVGLSVAVVGVGARHLLLSPRGAPEAAGPRIAVPSAPPVPSQASPAASSVVMPSEAPTTKELPRARVARSNGVPEPESGGDLRAEVAALDAASRALDRGDATGALSLIGTYWRSFPRGSLGLEAKVLEAECLDRAGRHEEAAARARAFLAHHPTSPLAGRMRQLAGR
jgi:hypothetical protein